MKPTPFNIEKRITAMESSPVIVKAKTPEKASPSALHGLILGLCLDTSLTSTAVAQSVQSYGGRHDWRTIDRIRELIEVTKE